MSKKWKKIMFSIVLNFNRKKCNAFKLSVKMDFL